VVDTPIFSAPRQGTIFSLLIGGAAIGVEGRSAEIASAERASVARVRRACGSRDQLP
jgi:hypothetical protein